MPQDGSSNFMMVNLPVVRSSFAFLTLAAVVLLSRHLIAHQVSVDAKKYLLGLYLLLVVVFTFRFGMCRLVVHFVRLLAIQQPGNTHGIYLTLRQLADHRVVFPVPSPAEFLVKHFSRKRSVRRSFG